jgi:Trk-type K+ transport system membrane component
VLGFAVLYLLCFVAASLTMTTLLHVYPDAITPPGEAAASSDTVVLTSVSSVAATLNNIGPGLSHVGSGDVRAYSWMPRPAKLVLVVCMLIGRLEVFAVVFLFVPWFYRN